MASGRARLALLFLAVILGLVSTSQAALFTKLGPPVTLADLLASSATIQAGDKAFSNFTYTPAGNAPAASAIVVEPVMLNGEYGLHFVGPWLAIGNQSLTASLGYQVSVQGTQDKISDIHLWAPGAGSIGTGNVMVVENAFAQVPGQALTTPLLAYASSQGLNLYSSADIRPTLTSMFVTKDIVVQGGGQGLGVLSEFFQTYSQAPEPVTLGLLAVGGLTLLRRRK